MHIQIILAIFLTGCPGFRLYIVKSKLTQLFIMIRPSDKHTILVGYFRSIR